MKLAVEVETQAKGSKRIRRVAPAPDASALTQILQQTYPEAPMLVLRKITAAMIAAARDEYVRAAIVAADGKALKVARPVRFRFGRREYALPPVKHRASEKAKGKAETIASRAMRGLGQKIEMPVISKEFDFDTGGVRPKRMARQAVQSLAGHHTADSPKLSQGSGLGLLSPSSKDGLRALDKFAVLSPAESWAGELAGPSALADRLGITRATLDNWRKSHDVIALPKGKNSHVYPVGQFHEGRPLLGIRAILTAANGNARVAWRWLITPHVDFDESPPLERLRQGLVQEIVEAAQRSLGLL